MNSLTWTELLDLMLPVRPIAKRTKSEGRVEYWRDWDPIFESAVWTKVYHGQQELAAFNQWEFDFLTQLSEHKVPQTYRAVDMRRKGTQLNLGTQFEIKTLHAGPTLDDWLYAPVQPLQAHPDRHIQAHCLVQPEHFVRMACSLLRALEAIHKSNYIHGDLHPGNISIPIRHLGDQKNCSNPTIIQFEIEWDKLTLIDFGFSINKHNTPKTTLPFKRNCYGARISPHLSRVLDEIELTTTQQLKAGETWLQVWLDSGFWQRWKGPSPLEIIKQVDWREDMYQLGMLLADIRDGKGRAKHLEGGTVRTSVNQEINSIIANLPEQLIEWGQGAGTPTPLMPHRQYINELDAALSGVLGQSATSIFALCQRDFSMSLPSPTKPACITPLASPECPMQDLTVTTSIAADQSQNSHCLIRQLRCGRKEGQPTCAKCGISIDTLPWKSKEEKDATFAQANEQWREQDGKEKKQHVKAKQDKATSALPPHIGTRSKSTDSRNVAKPSLYPKSSKSKTIVETVTVQKFADVNSSVEDDEKFWAIAVSLHSCEAYDWYLNKMGSSAMMRKSANERLRLLMVEDKQLKEPEKGNPRPAGSLNLTEWEPEVEFEFKLELRELTNLFRIKKN